MYGDIEPLRFIRINTRNQKWKKKHRQSNLAQFMVLLRNRQDQGEIKVNVISQVILISYFLRRKWHLLTPWDTSIMVHFKTLTCTLVALVENTSEQFITLTTCSRFLKGVHNELMPMICSTWRLSIVPTKTKYSPLFDICTHLYLSRCSFTFLSKTVKIYVSC